MKKKKSEYGKATKILKFEEVEEITNSNTHIPYNSEFLSSGMLYWFMEQENKIMQNIAIIFHINPLSKKDLERISIEYEKKGSLNYFVIIDNKTVGKITFTMPLKTQKATVEFEWLIEEEEILRMTNMPNGKK